MSDQLTLFLCGDVMTGRGVDQILPHPGNPELREPGMTDARDYVELAESVSGPIPRPADSSWIWGDALGLLSAAAPDLRLLNLETSVTSRGEFDAGKVVHYRMDPANIGCLTIAAPDACVLANNHVLDFGRQGLADTLSALAGAGLRTVGAGTDEAAARAPAIITAGDSRVVLFASGLPSAGVRPDWAARPALPGVDFLPGTSAATATDLAERIRAVRRPDDVVVISLHWGSNWGYQVDQDQVRFARWLIDAGADLVYGHSSHHPRPIEVYQGKLIIYGCGDFIDDYEGIAGYRQYRADLRLMFFASLRRATGELTSLRMVPLRARRMRLRRASPADTKWLATRLSQVSEHHGTKIELAGDGALTLADRDQAAPPRTRASGCGSAQSITG